MRHRIEAGTDGATLCAFDPAALPKDFDARVGDDPAGLMEALRDHGLVWVGDTGGDGQHQVEVRIDEASAPQAPVFRGSLLVPSGALWVCGAEYMARDPLNGSDVTPKGGLGRCAMGQKIDIPPGRYAMEVLAPAAPRGAAKGRALAQGLVLLGGLAAVVSGVVLAIAAVLKSVQWLMGNPMAGSGMNALPPLLAILGAGLLAVLIGRRLTPRPARSRALADADLILSLTKG